MTLLLALVLAQDAPVTLRLTAPHAKSVKLRGGLSKEPLDLLRGDDGVWSVTTPPVAPGFHYYWFDVDGLALNDPKAKTYWGWGRECGGIEIPEPGVDFYDAKPEVPLGEVRSRWYFSKATGAWRRCFVYTPAGYDGTSERYPVLYLRHGSGENERAWFEQGRANFILDNLIAAGEAKPMLLVGDSGYPQDAVEKVLLGELIPLIDATYRTRPEARALAGLSMGAQQALDVGLAHPEAFGWIAALSPGLRKGFDARTSFGGAFADPDAFGKRCRLLWIGAGTAEEHFHQAAKGMSRALSDVGVKHVFYESPGSGHEWQTWRRSLKDLAPRLFPD